MPEKMHHSNNKDVDVTLKPSFPFAFKVVNFLGKIFDNKGRLINLLHVDSMINKACKKTGLNDFGPDTFSEGFQTLINSLNEEGKLTTVGRIALHKILLNSLMVRLRIYDWVKEYPDVLNEQIEKPFINAGLPRSGTTILSFLMDMDPENRSLLQWESQNPVPPPQLASAGEDPRIFKAVKVMKLFKKMVPDFQAIHPINATMPTECTNLFAHEFLMPFSILAASIPSYLDWFKGVDMEPGYKLHKLILKILQNTIPVETWSLKSPMHIYRLETLLKTYPDARLIISYRDPKKVIASTCSLMANFRRGLCAHVDLNKVGLETVSIIKDFFEKIEKFDSEYSGSNCYRVQYNEFIKDPIGAVHEMYNFFGKKVSPLHEKRMYAWLKFNPQDKHGRHKYSLMDFGLSPDDVDEQFGKYRNCCDDR